MIYYFAYGSNLHPMRLMDRVPSAEFVEISSLEGYRLTFHKKSTDGSSKCNIFEAEKENDIVYGAIYKIDEAHKNDLDKIEGKGHGYIDNQLSIVVKGKEYLCFTYLAQQSHIVDDLHPYHWYKEMVVLGSKYLDFPVKYTEAIESITPIDDSDVKRKAENEILLRKMRDYI